MLLGAISCSLRSIADRDRGLFIADIAISRGVFCELPAERTRNPRGRRGNGQLASIAV